MVPVIVLAEFYALARKKGCSILLVNPFSQINIVEND